MLQFDAPDKLRASLKLHEGVRALPYTDTTGHLTIGVGHNLTSDGLPPTIIENLLDWDILQAALLTDRLLPWASALDDVRKRALTEMVFNLGSRILGFHQALAFGQAGRWPDAANAFRASLWAKQVGSRAVTLTAMLETGQDPLLKP
jgi:lysozyme